MLTQETSIRYLGVYIDYNISWKMHITNISKKIKRSIGILSKLSYFLSTKTLLSLYYALVEPFLNYCIIAWGNTWLKVHLYHLTQKPYMLSRGTWVSLGFII